MIVGASASGIQLAREIQAAGRRVVLSVGEHVRMPRTYRGRDIQWWMDAIGAMDLRYDAVRTSKGRGGCRRRNSSERRSA